MSLKGLFRSLLGGAPPAATTEPKVPTTAPAAGGVRPLRVAPQTIAVETTASLRQPSTRRGKPDPMIAGWVADLKNLSRPGRVVLVGAGDGSFAADLLAAISNAFIDRQTAPIVAIVDSFEAGGGLPLKSLHSQLRGIAVRPQIVPEPIDRAVVNLAHRIGRADVVLIADSQWANQWDATAATSKLRHDQTAIHVHDGQRWVRRGDATRRAA